MTQGNAQPHHESDIGIRFPRQESKQARLIVLGGETRDVLSGNDRHSKSVDDESYSNSEYGEHDRAVQLKG